MAAMLSACNMGRGKAPTPAFVGELAKPPHLPERPPITPTPGAVSPTVAPATPTASPQTPTVETGAEVRQTSPVSGRLPGAYVKTTSVALAETPGGKVLARLPAGIRLGILDQSANGSWLKVQYQPDPDAEAQTGWVRADHLAIFADLEDLPKNVEQVTTNETSVTGLGAATVNANRLNVRAGPGTDQQIVDVLSRGDQIQLIGRSDNSEWLQVQLADGETGWVAARWSTPVIPIETLPVTGSATTSVPRLSAARGKIVFQTQNGGDIYIIDANGSDLRHLTYGFDPALSPDGKKVAFTRLDDPPGLWVINADGTGERRLFTANRPRSPTWTPDGQALIFERNTHDKQCRETPLGCFTDEQLRKEFGGEDCISTPFGEYCIWDFRLITLYITSLVRYNFVDSAVRDIPAANNASAPYHHPRNHNVLYLSRDGLSITKDVGNDPPVLQVQATDLGPAVYSPDGQFIYVSRRSGDHWDIWRYRSDGGDGQALTAPPGLRDASVHNVSPALSPDGRSVLFLTNRRGKWELWVMNADGGNPRPFAPQTLRNIDFQYGFARERIADWGP